MTDQSDKSDWSDLSMIGVIQVIQVIWVFGDISEKKSECRLILQYLETFHYF